jgi:Zn-dependent protease
MLQNLIQDFDLQYTITILFAFFISISFHEMSHAWRADRLGDDTARHAGRLTMNPIAHLDPIGTLMILFVGVGWAKPVPINPVLFTRAKTMKRGIMEVSLAGPLSNLILAFGSYLILNIILLLNNIITGSYENTNVIFDTVINLFYMLVHLNVFLAVFNLFPIPPLDGFKIFGSMLPDNIYYKIMDYERYIGIAFLALVFFAGSIFGRVLDILTTPIFFLIESPIDLLFGLFYNLFNLI